MDNITLFTDEKTGQEFVIIDLGNGEFNSLPKSVYEERKANKDNPVGGN